MVPRTRFGAFARGAKVVLYTKKSGAHLRIIDGGSGYLCEMEPVAHFGLGESGPGEGLGNELLMEQWVMLSIILSDTELTA